MTTSSTIVIYMYIVAHFNSAGLNSNSRVPGSHRFQILMMEYTSFVLVLVLLQLLRFLSFGKFIDHNLICLMFPLVLLGHQQSPKCVMMSQFTVLNLILPTPKVISLCHQYRAGPACTIGHSDHLYTVG